MNNTVQTGLAPRHYTNSHNCPHYVEGICPRSMVVPFSGPEDARLVVVGEAPGRQENDKGVPFIGDSGQELDRLYLPAAGVRRESVLVANAVCCMPKLRNGNRTPSRELVKHCSSRILLPWLESLLEQRERVVVALGSVSSRVLSDNPPEPGIVEPLPGGWLLCAPHPAAAMRSTGRISRVMDEILRSFRTAGRLMRNPTDVLATPAPCAMRLCTGNSDLVYWLGEPDTVAVDTETMGFASSIYCLSFAADTAHGARSAVLLERDADLRHLVDWLCRRNVVMHNALYDIEAIASAAGYDAADRLLEVVDDTMLLAYEIRGLPLGLKPLASMLCGYRMQDYESVMLPQFRQALVDILRSSADQWRSAVDTHPCCTLGGSLFNDYGSTRIPSHLRPQRSETPEQYSLRLKEIGDDVLRPLAGRSIEALQGRDGYKFSCLLLEEIDSRFAWTSAVETATVCARRAESSGSMRDLQKVLHDCRSNSMLARHLPRSVYELLPVINQEVLASYAAQDAEATLAVWKILSMEVTR